MLGETWGSDFDWNSVGLGVRDSGRAMVWPEWVTGVEFQYIEAVFTGINFIVLIGSCFSLWWLMGLPTEFPLNFDE